MASFFQPTSRIEVSFDDSVNNLLLSSDLKNSYLKKRQSKIHFYLMAHCNNNPQIKTIVTNVKTSQIRLFGEMESS